MLHDEFLLEDTYPGDLSMVATVGEMYEWMRGPLVDHFICPDPPPPLDEPTPPAASCEAAPAAFEAVVPSMARYVGYAGGQTVNGMLRLTSEAGGALTVSGVLTGLEPSTSGGWHVHSGSSCTDAAGAGGHYFDGLATDPWLPVKWHSDANGVAVVSLTIDDFTLDPAGVRYVGGRTVVVHEAGGDKAACGVIEPYDIVGDSEAGSGAAGSPPPPCTAAPPSAPPTLLRRSFSNATNGTHNVCYLPDTLFVGDNLIEVRTLRVKPQTKDDLAYFTSPDRTVRVDGDAVEFGGKWISSTGNMLGRSNDEEDADEFWNVSSKLSLPYDPKGKFYRLRASAGGDPKEVFGRFGWYGYYKFGGYIASLYGPPDEARAQIDELMANDFVDKYTRAVQVSTVVGNPNKNLWALATVLFEFPEEGELRITSEACVGAKPLAHVGLAKLLQISDLPLVVLITLSLYLFLNEMGRLRTKGVRNWLLKPQTYYDCAMMSLAFVAINVFRTSSTAAPTSRAPLHLYVAINVFPPPPRAVLQSAWRNSSAP